MNNYDKFLRGKPMIERVIRHIHLARGQDKDGHPDAHNDKHTLQFQPEVDENGMRDLPRLRDTTWSPAVILIEMTYGYYGSSSGYSAMDRETAKYIMRACNALVPQIADKAIELARADLDAMRQEAQEEARSVMQQVAT